MDYLWDCFSISVKHSWYDLKELGRHSYRNATRICNLWALKRLVSHEFLVCMHTCTFYSFWVIRGGKRMNKTKKECKKGRQKKNKVEFSCLVFLTLRKISRTVFESKCLASLCCGYHWAAPVPCVLPNPYIHLPSTTAFCAALMYGITLWFSLLHYFACQYLHM